MKLKISNLDMKNENNWLEKNYLQTLFTQRFDNNGVVRMYSQNGSCEESAEKI